MSDTRTVNLAGATLTMEHIYAEMQPIFEEVWASRKDGDPWVHFSITATPFLARAIFGLATKEGEDPVPPWVLETWFGQVPLSMSWDLKQAHDGNECVEVRRGDPQPLFRLVGMSTSALDYRDNWMIG